MQKRTLPQAKNRAWEPAKPPFARRFLAPLGRDGMVGDPTTASRISIKRKRARRDDWVVGYNMLRQRPEADPAVIVGNFVEAMAYVWGQTGPNETPLFARWASNIIETLYKRGQNEGPSAKSRYFTAQFRQNPSIRSLPPNSRNGSRQNLALRAISSVSFAAVRSGRVSAKAAPSVPCIVQRLAWIFPVLERVTGIDWIRMQYGLGNVFAGDSPGGLRARSCDVLIGSATEMAVTPLKPAGTRYPPVKDSWSRLSVDCHRWPRSPSPPPPPATGRAPAAHQSHRQRTDSTTLIPPAGYGDGGIHHQAIAFAPGSSSAIMGFCEPDHDSLGCGCHRLIRHGQIARFELIEQPVQQVQFVLVFVALGVIEQGPRGQAEHSHQL